MIEEKMYTDSKVVSKLKYNGETKELDVTYLTGKTFRYFDFSEQMFKDAISEKSIGSFMNRVKNHYRCEELA
jgi:hypothetical protein